jgi:hypothetical protein
MASEQDLQKQWKEFLMGDGLGKNGGPSHQWDFWEANYT